MSIRFAAISATGLTVVAAVLAFVVLNPATDSGQDSLPPLRNGWSGVPAEGEPTISRAEALAIADERNQTYAETASSVVARYLLLSSKYRYFDLDNTPVWVVTYENVKMYGHGSGVGEFVSHWSVIIDTETGELIRGYTAGANPAVLSNAD